MTHRRAWLIGAICATAMVAEVIAGVALFTCPDCDNAVSPRATFCPKCGCPGDDVRKHHEDLAKKVVPDPRTYVLSIRSSNGTGMGVVVTEADSTYAVFPSSLLAGATSFQISPVTTNEVLSYKDLELADDRPLARFSITSTNVIAVKASSSLPLIGDKISASLPSSDSVLAVTSIASRVSAVTKSSLSFNLAQAAEMGQYPLLTASTNLVGFDTGAEVGISREATLVSTRIKWVPAGPKEYRMQSGLMSEARLAVQTRPKNPTKIWRRLRATKWLTSHMKRESGLLADVIEKQWRK